MEAAKTFEGERRGRCGSRARIAGVVAQLESEQKEVERLQKELKDNATVHKTTLILSPLHKRRSNAGTELKSELTLWRRRRLCTRTRKEMRKGARGAVG